DVAERRTQRSGRAVAGVVHRDLGVVLAPVETAAALGPAVGFEIDANLLDGFPIARAPRVAQTEHRPRPEPRVDRPAAGGAHLDERIGLALVAEHADLSLDDLHELHEFERRAVAVRRLDDVRARDELLEDRDR